MIYYGRQSISAEDIQAVLEVLSSNFLTQGPRVVEFEAALSARCAGAQAVAVSTATDGLYLAYRALGLGPSDLLWTTPNTFVATSNAARFCGARVDFVDIDFRTGNMDVTLLEKKLQSSRASHTLPKIVTVVHFAGQPCDMLEVAKLSREYGFKVVEDACHALGSTYDGRPIGNCEYSDFAVFSFHPVKSITTGEGGAVMARNPELVDRLRLLRSHGITRDTQKLKSRDVGTWYYEMQELSGNYRISDIHCALGTSQLKRLDQFISRREELFQKYAKVFSAFKGVSLLEDRPHRTSARHLCVARIDFKELGLTKKSFFENMKEMGVELNVHYIPVHLHPYYRELGFKIGQFPESEKYYEQAVTLPLYFELTDDQQKTVIQAMQRCLTAGKVKG